MNLDYTVDTADRLVTITGEYSNAEEWQALLTRILDDTRIREGFAFLRDLRGADTPTDAATVVRIMEIVRRLWPHLNPTRAAILTPRPIDSAALVAQALADAQHLPIEIFTSYESAVEWLRSGRPAPEGGASAKGAQ